MKRDWKGLSGDNNLFFGSDQENVIKKLSAFVLNYQTLTILPEWKHLVELHKITWQNGNQTDLNELADFFEDDLLGGFGTEDVVEFEDMSFNFGGRSVSTF